MDDFIRTVVSICDAVKGKKHAKKQIHLSFDEWNVWYHSREQDEEIWKQEKWGPALPLLEDVYNFEDALLAGSMLITLLRNADRVKIACVAQLDTSATLGDDNSVTVFVVNRDLKEDCLLDIDLRVFGDLKLQEHILLHHSDVKAVNTEEHPDTVVPAAGPGGTVDGGKAQIKVPALSWNVLRFAK